MQITTDIFINRAINKHSNKYDYSLVDYINSKTKVIIRCIKHGQFTQAPSNHLNGNGCPKCGTDNTINLKRINDEEFIKRAIEKHGNKYDYSLVNYINSSQKVKIICKTHGEFEQTPNTHLGGHGCMECGRIKIANAKYIVKDINEFIIKANKKHDYKYDYSESLFSRNKHIKIICPQHGDFYQKIQPHLRGNGCKKCSIDYVSSLKILTSDEFINKAIEKHGDKYDYSLVHYVKAKKKVSIICHEHGVFLQTPDSHLNGRGCQICATISTNKKNTYDTSEFIKRAIKKHGNRYDYSLVDYVSGKDNIIIICKYHGNFFQNPSVHLRGHGCYECTGQTKLTTETFIEKANCIHGDIYDYRLVNYSKINEKVDIICKKHGIFKQIAHAHLQGKGCSTCRLSKSEKKLYDIIKTKYNAINSYRNKKILGRQHLDIFIPEYNVAIEYQGIQHFKWIKGFFGGEEAYYKNKKRDLNKKEKCEKNNIKLFYFTYEKENISDDYENIIYTDTDDLLTAISEYIN